MCHLETNVIKYLCITDCLLLYSSLVYTDDGDDDDDDVDDDDDDDVLRSGLLLIDRVQQPLSNEPL